VQNRPQPAALYVGAGMFGSLLAAGVLLALSGLEVAQVLAVLAFFSASGVGMVTTLVKLGTVERSSAELVEQGRYVGPDRRKGGPWEPGPAPGTTGESDRR